MNPITSHLSPSLTRTVKANKLKRRELQKETTNVKSVHESNYTIICYRGHFGDLFQSHRGLNFKYMYIFRGRGEWEPGNKGGRSLREAGKEKAGSRGILKVEGTGSTIYLVPVISGTGNKLLKNLKNHAVHHGTLAWWKLPPFNEPSDFLERQQRPAVKDFTHLG